MKEEYLKTDYSDLKVVKTEIMLTPLLIVLPMVVAVFLINDWFIKGSSRDGELMLAIIILVGNIMFDIPFVSSMIQYKKILSQYKKLSKKLKEIKLFNKP